MIPLKLYLKNFLSYGPHGQTINFEPYHLICLNGKNGHGKSALLDAITWAIWGQARKIAGASKPDSHLLHLGQTHMTVIFDFMFNNQIYKIKREYSQTYGKPYAVLDFGLVDAHTKKTNPLTDKTIKATQDKIENMIGLDFDSFINSAFLRQGQSNEFSKKSAKERKDILATILSLQHYEILRKRALEKAKQASSDSHYLQQTQERLLAQLTALDSITQEIATIKHTLSMTEHELSIHNTKLEELQNVKKKYQDLQNFLSLTRFKKEQADGLKKNKQETVLSVYREWRIINRKKNILQPAQLDDEKKNLIVRIDKHQQALQKNLTLKERYLEHKEQEQTIIQEKQKDYQLIINQKQRVLEQVILDHRSLSEALSKLQITKKDLHDEHQAVTLSIASNQKIVDAITLLEPEKKRLEKRFEKRKNTYHAWVAQLTFLEQEYRKLEQKKTLTHDSNNPSCPLCEQNLSASRKRFLQAKFVHLEDAYIHKIKRLKRILKQLKELLLQDHAILETYKKQEEEKTLALLTITELFNKKELSSLQLKNIDTDIANVTGRLGNAAMQLEQEKKALEALQNNFYTILNTDLTYQAHQEAVHAIIEEQKTVIYNQEEHHNAIKELSILEEKRKEALSLQEALVLQKQRKESIHELCKELKSINRNLASIIFTHQKLENECQELEKTLCLEETLKNTLTVLNQTKETVLQKKATLEQQQRTLHSYQEEVDICKKKSQLLQDNCNDFITIAHALGKEGIQALLIEDALPEIEFEANELLAQLTNNQAHIIIESLRDLKKGGTKETLDIKISDPLGVRPYELFSGGEAFRIDFALRIAISKLLARRAGTSLQTLIIDEGFGSQDEEGIMHMMDALHKIQDSFAKIIIVSHLSVMKEQFPVHFLIQKGPQGSTIQIIEH